MKRSGFKRAVYERPPRTPIGFATNRLLRGVYARADAGSVAVEKDNALQHQGYMDVVRSMTCARCGKPGPSQFCHRDEGKGMGIKTDCRDGWPGCAECHHYVGMSGKLGKEGRRAFEDAAALQTRDRVTVMGLWPADL